MPPRLRKHSKPRSEAVSIAMGFALAAVFLVVGGLHFLSRGTDRHAGGSEPAPSYTTPRDPGIPEPRRIKIIIRNIPTLRFPVEPAAAQIHPTGELPEASPGSFPAAPHAVTGLTTLVGTIMNSENEMPVAGAVVRARVGDTEIETFSDTTGSFRLVGVPADVGSVSITIAAPGYAPLTIETPVSQEKERVSETHLALVPVGILSGRVTDSEGLPLRFAEVSVAPENATAHDAWLFSARTITNAEGLFSFAGLRRVYTYLLSVSHAEHSDWNKGGIRLLEFPTETRLEVQLTRRGVLYGKVIDSDGVGIGGVRVIATHSQTRTASLAISEPDGKYRIKNLSTGKYTVSANAPRLLPFQASVNVEGSTLLAIQMRKRGVIEGKCVVDDGGPLPSRTTVQLSRTGRQNGSTGMFEKLVTRTYYTARQPKNVLLADSASAVSASLVEQPISVSEDPSIVTGWTGYIYFDDLDEGKYSLVIEGDGLLLAEFKDIEVTFERAATNLVFTLKRGAVMLGCVLSAESGLPIEDALVAVYEAGTSEAQPYGRKVTEVVSRDDGHFVVDGLPTGMYHLLIVHNFFQPDSLTVCVHDSDRLVQTRIYMKPAGAISGVILNASGEPQPFGCLLVTSEDGRTSLIVTADRDGKFLLGALKPGKYRITDTDELVEVLPGKQLSVTVRRK